MVDFARQLMRDADLMLASDPSLDLRHVFVLGEAYIRGALQAQPTSSVDFYGLLTGDVRPDLPIRFKCVRKGLEPDILAAGSPTLLLTSARLSELLMRERFSGWTTYEVDISCKPSLTTKYLGLTVTGRSGPIDDASSEAMILPPADPTRRPLRRWRGLFFDPRTWDGSDVFLADGSLWVFVTERVAEAVRSANLSNVELRTASEIERAAL